ncbi:MAG: SRPBCC domain-containing protein, partial [Acidimicrobiia bacterium]|nr:SRPBCC domain-containing protein [Acidimicrobiia bacterium]
YGPTGASIPVAKLDVRVGGKRHICMEMQTPNGPMQMWFTGEFTEVEPHTRLVYTDAMADEDGNVLSPQSMGLPEGHPESTDVIVELEDLGGATRMTMTHVGVPADSPGAAGWNMAFDKLATHLESA